MQAKKLLEYCKIASDINNPNKIEYGKNIVAGQNQLGYVYGAKGVVYTADVAQRLVALKYKPPDYFYRDCNKWMGKFVLDCSGLITWALRKENPKLGEQNSATLYNTCTKKGVIKDIPNVAGLFLWHKGHIGIYAGNGVVYESKGSHYGVVQSLLVNGKWTNYGYGRDVEYPNTVALKPIARTLRSGMSGEDVEKLQSMLQKLNYEITVNGTFDEKTQEAVKAFQRKKKLAVVGYAGVKTMAALEVQL